MTLIEEARKERFDHAYRQVMNQRRSNVSRPITHRSKTFMPFVVAATEIMEAEERKLKIK